MDLSKYIPNIFTGNKSSDDPKPAPPPRQRTTKEQREVNPVNLTAAGDAIVDRREEQQRQLNELEK